MNPNQPNKGDGYTPLIISSLKGHLPIVKYLIEECKVNPNQANITGNTALIVSTAEGKLPVVKYLIEECKVDPNQLADEGDFPLILGA